MNSNLAAANVADIARRNHLRCFALELTGDALLPRHAPGDLLIVDTEAIPAAGDCVVTEIDSVLCCLCLNADGDLVDNRGGYAERGTYYCIGVIVEGAQ